MVICVFLVCLTVIQLLSMYFGLDGQIMSLIVGAMSAAVTGLMAYLMGQKNKNDELYSMYLDAEKEIIEAKKKG